jgi:hypothetical protein
MMVMKTNVISPAAHGNQRSFEGSQPLSTLLLCAFFLIIIGRIQRIRS